MSKPMIVGGVAAVRCPTELDGDAALRPDPDVVRQPLRSRTLLLHNKVRTTLLTLGAATLLTTAVSGCGADEGETPAPAANQVEILELQVENDQYAAPDIDRPGMSIGDMDVFSGNAIKDGRKVGRGGGTCQVIHIDGEKVTTQCVLTMQLETGSVTMQALWVRGSSPLDMAITGGTGTYLNVGGTVRFWDIGTPNERVRAEIIR